MHTYKYRIKMWFLVPRVVLVFAVIHTAAIYYIDRLQTSIIIIEPYNIYYNVPFIIKVYYRFETNI